MGRRSSSPLIDLFQDINDDTKDFVDDEIVDRTRTSERDLRRAGRRWYDDDDDRGGRSRRGRRGDDGIEELWESVRALTRQVAAIAEQRTRGGASRSDEQPFPGYDDMTVNEINGRLPSLTQDELSAVARYERTHDGRVTVLDRVETLQGDEPWSGYDEQTVAEVRKRLGNADEETLEQVRDYERRHKDRQGVLDAVQHALS